ncbi:MAG: hypothetical protein QM831_07480 [Kofleriaceae bacterium]
MKTEIFRTSVLGARADARITKVVREVSYGATQKSIDIVALSDRAELVFGEVKHWSTSTWIEHRNEVFAQLEAHNGAVAEIVRKLDRRITDVKAKVLFVSREGFSGLKPALQDQITARAGKLGWTMKFVENSQIENFGQLIDRVR